MSTPGRAWVRWFLYLIVLGGALLVSQSRGPWIAAGAMSVVALLIIVATVLLLPVG